MRYIDRQYLNDFLTIKATMAGFVSDTSATYIEWYGLCAPIVITDIYSLLQATKLRNFSFDVTVKAIMPKLEVAGIQNFLNCSNIAYRYFRWKTDKVINPKLLRLRNSICGEDEDHRVKLIMLDGAFAIHLDSKIIVQGLKLAQLGRNKFSVYLSDKMIELMKENIDRIELDEADIPALVRYVEQQFSDL